MLAERMPLIANISLQLTKKKKRKTNPTKELGAEKVKLF